MYSIATKFEYSDPQLNLGLAAINELSIHISMDGFSFCITNPETHHALYIKDYRFVEDLSLEDVANLISEINYWDETLRIPYQRVRVMFDCQQETIVPDQLFDEHQASKLLRLLFKEPNYPVHLLSRSIRSMDCWTVSQIPLILSERLKSHQPQAEIFTSTAPILERMVSERFINPYPKFILNIQRNYFQIFISENGRLTFHNQFYTPHPNDIVYFVAFVVDQLNFDTENLVIRLIGTIETVSPEYQLLKNYFRNVSFEKNPSIFHGRVIDKIPVHRYINLLNLSLCE
ncbi:MAG TPA: DUF3822 family protein [Salinivirgaceae bacterium]|nr:DUF3822 family protein [Salinivirgaceae bacterium]